MTHYVCKGTCEGSSAEIAVCEAEGCNQQWNMMQECDCTDGRHGKEELSEALLVKDSNGALLKDGDSVTLIKDLTLKGSSQVIKIGTKVNNIRLTDDPEEIDCKIGGTAIVLRTEFLKKL